MKLKEDLIREIEMIAGFMGFEGQHEDWCGNNIEVEDQYSETGKSMIPYRPNEDYNQLFEVVEKIESMGYYHSIYRNSVDKGRAYSSFSNKDCSIIGEYSPATENRIIAVYRNVVNMVEHLNKIS